MKRVSTLAFLVAATTLSAPAFAATLTTDLAAWQAAAGDFTRDTEYGESFDVLSSLTLADGTTLNFGSDVEVRTIGESWGTWSGGYTGDVLWSLDASSVSATFETPVDDFGFYAEPNNFAIYTITLTLDDGSEISQDVNGDSGAAFFGWNGAGIASFTITAADDAAGFAFGDIYVSTSAAPVVPEPSTWAMMLAGFGAIGYAMRRRGVARRTLQAA